MSLNCYENNAGTLRLVLGRHLVGVFFETLVGHDEDDGKVSLRIRFLNISDQY